MKMGGGMEMLQSLPLDRTIQTLWYREEALAIKTKCFIMTIV
jgi:hypothetical protein